MVQSRLRIPTPCVHTYTYIYSFTQVNNFHVQLNKFLIFNCIITEEKNQILNNLEFKYLIYMLIHTQCSSFMLVFFSNSVHIIITLHRVIVKNVHLKIKFRMVLCRIQTEKIHFSYEDISILAEKIRMNIYFNR